MGRLTSDLQHICLSHVAQNSSYSSDLGSCLTLRCERPAASNTNTHKKPREYSGMRALIGRDDERNMGSISGQCDGLPSFPLSCQSIRCLNGQAKPFKLSLPAEYRKEIRFASAPVPPGYFPQRFRFLYDDLMKPVHERIALRASIGNTEEDDVLGADFLAVLQTFSSTPSSRLLKFLRIFEFGWPLWYRKASSQDNLAKFKHCMEHQWQVARTMI